MYEKIILYGIGKGFDAQIIKLSSMYEIIGFSDKTCYSSMQGYILPNEIQKYDFDYVCITSSHYYEEIKLELINKYGIPEDRILDGALIVKKDYSNKAVRDRWIIKQLHSLECGKKILDAGAGEQQYKQYCSHLQYISQDFCQYVGDGNVGLQNEAWDTSKIDIVSDITNIPISDSSMDVILCTEVFEHIADPIQAVNEFARILNKGGKLILSAPFASLTHMAPYHYYTGYNKYWYEKILLEKGFKILEITSYGDYFEYMMQELIRIPYITERYSDTDLSREERMQLAESAKILKKISGKSKGSEELLCFGYLIVAEYIG